MDDRVNPNAEHSGEANVLAEGIRRVRALPERLFGGLSYHRGPVFANRFGYQIFRTMYRHAGWQLRSVPVTGDVEGYVRALDRDGCVVIPNFLPDDVFRELRAEYDRSRANLAYESPVIEDNKVVEERVDVGHSPEHFPVLWKHLVQGPRLLALASGSMRRPISVRPRAWSMYWHKDDNAVIPRGGDHVKGANYVHADMHYPTLKAFLYLSDTDERNGAFQFALGSHRITPSRLAYEYDASIRVAASRRDGSYATTPYAIIRAPSDKQRKAMAIELTSMNGKANTMILANTQGFHQQGVFQPGTFREAILLCFRTSEPGGHTLIPPGDQQ